MSNVDNMINIRTVDVKNFFHDTGMGRIFCTMIGTPNQNKECVLYFSPLFEERIWSQRIAFSFARELALLGKHVVLMFDYHGYGESDGEADDFTLAGCRDDLKSLIVHMGSWGLTKFSWWGIRTGCAIALASLPGDLSISSAFFWAPVLNLREYIYDSLRSTITAQYIIFNKAIVTRDVILEELAEFGKCDRDGYRLNHIEGYRFGKAFYQETQKIEQVTSLSLLNFPTLILEQFKPGKKNYESHIKLTKIAEASQANPNISYFQVSERQFWIIGKDYSQRAEELFSATSRWLDDLNI